MADDAPQASIAKDNLALVVFVVCFVMLMAGYLLKVQCTAPEGYDGRQYSRLCYNDIQPLYSARAIDHNAFPYINGAFTDDGQLIGGAVEYPVLTGLFLWFTGLFVEDGNAFLKISALFLMPFGLITAYLLLRMTGWRALMWAASPALVWYSFHNWDLLVVAAVVAGIWSWHRGRSVAAAVWFGVGGALKMYPILFVAPLALERWHAGKRAEAARVFAAGSGALIALNLPFMLINFSGWWATYDFHKVRGPNYDSIWGLLADGSSSPWLFVPKLNLLVAISTLTWFGLALGVGWWRATKDGVYPFLQVAGALLVSFLLWNKVHSPQYTLWLLPFFVMLRVHVLWWIAYAAVDTLAYVSIFKWFFDIAYEGEFFATPAKNGMVGAVWMRAALLAVLFVVFLRSRPALDDEFRGEFEPEPSLPLVLQPSTHGEIRCS